MVRAYVPVACSFCEHTQTAAIGESDHGLSAFLLMADAVDELTCPKCGFKAMTERARDGNRTTNR